MTSKELHEVMESIFEECRCLRKQGQKEYSRDEDSPFANFKRIGFWLGKDQKEVLIVYALKHLDGILSYIRGHKSQREDVRGRINDLILYLILLRGMIEEETGDI
jgi:hypothetical protein